MRSTAPGFWSRQIPFPDERHTWFEGQPGVCRAPSTDRLGASDGRPTVANVAAPRSPHGRRRVSDGRPGRCRRRTTQRPALRPGLLPPPRRGCARLAVGEHDSRNAETRSCRNAIHHPNAPSATRSRPAGPWSTGVWADPSTGGGAGEAAVEVDWAEDFAQLLDHPRMVATRPRPRRTPRRRATWPLDTTTGALAPACLLPLPRQSRVRSASAGRSGRGPAPAGAPPAAHRRRRGA